MSNQVMSRRNFLKSLGLAAGATALGGAALATDIHASDVKGITTVDSGDIFNYFEISAATVGIDSGRVLYPKMSDIYSYENGRKTKIAGSALLDDMGGEYASVLVSDQSIYPNLYGSLDLINLVDKTRVTIGPCRDLPYGGTIDGDNFVYYNSHREGDTKIPAYREVVVRKISTGTETVITRLYNDEEWDYMPSKPIIRGSKIAWSRHFGSRNSVYLYDMNTNEERELTPGHLLDFDGYAALISFSYGEVRVMDIDTKETYKIGCAAGEQGWCPETVGLDITFNRSRLFNTTDSLVILEKDKSFHMLNYKTQKTNPILDIGNRFSQTIIRHWDVDPRDRKIVLMGKGITSEDKGVYIIDVDEILNYNRTSKSTSEVLQWGLRGLLLVGTLATAVGVGALWNYKRKSSSRKVLQEPTKVSIAVSAPVQTLQPPAYLPLVQPSKRPAEDFAQAEKAEEPAKEKV